MIFSIFVLLICDMLIFAGISWFFSTWFYCILGILSMILSTALKLKLGRRAWY